MASTTLTTLLIAMVLVGLTAGTILGFMGVMSSNFEVTEDNTTTAIFSKIENLTIQNVTSTNKVMRDSSTGVDSGGLISQVADIVGAFFSGGYQALKQAMGAADIMNVLISDSTDKIGIGSFKNALFAIVGVFIFLTIIIGALVKWDRI